MNSYWNQQAVRGYDGLMTPDDKPQPIVALVKDLMFSSKISATARAAGQVMVIVRRPESLSEHAGRLLLVDLSVPGAIDAAVAWKQAHKAPAIGFVSHVDTATIARARDAGIDQVQARGAFAAQLESLLHSR